MSPITQRRGTVALIVLTLLVVSVDAANAVERRSTSPGRMTRASQQAATSYPRPAIAGRRPKPGKAATHKRPTPAAPSAHQTPLPPPRRLAATRTHRTARITGPTGWAPLDGAIARIPSYRPGAAIWRVSDRYGHWGTADWYRATLYISPGVPVARVYDVAVHEWSHELSVLDYGGDVASAVVAMNSVFGGDGLTGAERAADCMAKLQGASYTHYTSCRDRSWRLAAARLLAGHRL